MNGEANKRETIYNRGVRSPGGGFILNKPAIDLLFEGGRVLLTGGCPGGATLPLSPAPVQRFGPAKKSELMGPTSVAESLPNESVNQDGVAAFDAAFEAVYSSQLQLQPSDLQPEPEMTCEFGFQENIRCWPFACAPFCYRICIPLVICIDPCGQCGRPLMLFLLDEFE